MLKHFEPFLSSSWHAAHHRNSWILTSPPLLFMSAVSKEVFSVSASVTHRFWMVAVAGSKHLLFNFLSLTTASSWYKGLSLDRETEELGSLKEILHLPAFLYSPCIWDLKLHPNKTRGANKMPWLQITLFWDKKPTWRASVRAAI